MQAAAAYLPPVPPNVEPDAPGPFAFANQERVRTILAAAGFEAVNVAPPDEAVGSGSLESALALSPKVGMLGRFLHPHPAIPDVPVAPVPKPPAAAGMAAAKETGGPPGLHPG